MNEETEGANRTGSTGSKSKSVKSEAQMLEETLDLTNRQIQAMMSYAKDRGKRVSNEVFLSLKEAESVKSDAPEQRLTHLNKAHNLLANVVKPAKPAAVLYLMKHRGEGGFLGRLGPIPVVRWLLVIAIICSALYVAAAVVGPSQTEVESTGLLTAKFVAMPQNADSSDTVSLINPADTADSLEEQSDTTRPLNPVRTSEPEAPVGGTAKVAYAVKPLFAAALGVVFLLLYQVHGHLRAGSFDPQYLSEYASRFVLGVMGGVIVSYVFAYFIFGNSDETSLAVYGRDGLAFLAGFSIEAVHRMLQRMAATLRTAVGPDEKETLAQQAELANQAAESKVKEIANSTALDLTKILARFEGDASNKDILAELRKLLNGLSNMA
jgi:hypothetical protein